LEQVVLATAAQLHNYGSSRVFLQGVLAPGTKDTARASQEKKTTLANIRVEKTRHIRPEK
jgi:hypothetical protein